MPESPSMLQQAYGSPWGKSTKIDWSKIPELKMPEESLTMVIDPASYSSSFTQIVLKDIQRQMHKLAGISQQDKNDASDALSYYLTGLSTSQIKRHSITTTHRLNPLLLLCN